MSNRLTKDQFIKRATKVHGNKYDYSLVDYQTAHLKVKIGCKEHGVFEQTYSKHVFSKTGCPSCNPKKILLTPQQFIERAENIHGKKYDYSLVEYKGANKKVSISCPVHGMFQQDYTSHVLSKCGCPSCAGNNQLTTQDFVQRAKRIHGNNYDYSLVHYKNAHEKVKIICSTHGIFELQYASHIFSKTGCPLCYTDTLVKNTQEFIAKAKTVHGTKYDYSKVIYTHCKRPVVIICSLHGEFKQKPNHHTSGKHGCPQCANVSRPGYYNIGNSLTNNLDGILYLVEVDRETPKEHFLKVGITKRNVRKRFYNTLQVKPLYEQPMALNQAMLVEQDMLKTFESEKYTPLSHFNGHTECFNYSLNNINTFTTFLQTKDISYVSLI